MGVYPLPASSTILACWAMDASTCSSVRPVWSDASARWLADSRTSQARSEMSPSARWTSADHVSYGPYSVAGHRLHRRLDLAVDDSLPVLDRLGQLLQRRLGVPGDVVRHVAGELARWLGRRVLDAQQRRQRA